MACWRRRLTFNGWIILVDEVALDQLDGQARLSHTTAADHDQLVFSEELRMVSGHARGRGQGRAGPSRTGRQSQPRGEGAGRRMLPLMPLQMRSGEREQNKRAPLANQGRGEAGATRARSRGVKTDGPAIGGVRGRESDAVCAAETGWG